MAPSSRTISTSRTTSVTLLTLRLDMNPALFSNYDWNDKHPSPLAVFEKFWIKSLAINSCGLSYPKFSSSKAGSIQSLVMKGNCRSVNASVLVVVVATSITKKSWAITAKWTEKDIQHISWMKVSNLDMTAANWCKKRIFSVFPL